MSYGCAGIDVDIDVEHEGQKTKVTPPSQGGVVDEDMEVGVASSGSGASGVSKNSSEGGANTEAGANEGSKVSG